MIAFLDIEASGFGPGSWPVEIGWAFPFDRKRNGSVLVRPIPAWTHWDMTSQSNCHGLSRDFLEKEGSLPAEALGHIEDALSGCTIYVQDPEYDRSWFRVLVEAAGRDSTIRLNDAGALFEARALRRRHNLSAIRRDVAARFPHSHRAEADARQMAEIWRALVR